MTATPATTSLYGPDADPDKANRPPPVPPFLLTLDQRTTDEVKDHWPALILPKLKRDRDGLRWAWRSVLPDFTSSNGYRWPFPGHWAEAPGPFQAHKQACPTAVGDGICLAWTIRGATSSGMKLGIGLICGYQPDDVLGTNDDGNHTVKFRVRKAWVGEVIGTIAELTLGSADLRSADLRSADLRSADLRYANLRYANLGSADLCYADLRYADLRYADLCYADLRYANLRSADLRYANNLSSSSLAGARYSQLTLWPQGFDPKAAGAVLET